MVQHLIVEALATLAREVWAAAQKLAAAPAASAAELQSKFELQPQTFKMSYGDAAQFNQGLAGLIGPPKLPLREAMEAEARHPRCAHQVMPP